MENLGMPQEMGEQLESEFETIIPPISEGELKEICLENEKLTELLEQMLDYASRYVRDVWEMQSLLERQGDYTDQNEWAELYAEADDKRGQLHDTYVDSIAILSRNMAKAGLDIEWVRELAPTGTLERSSCGRFAIMLMFERYKTYKLSIAEDNVDEHAK